MRAEGEKDQGGFVNPVQETLHFLLHLTGCLRDLSNPPTAMGQGVCDVNTTISSTKCCYWELIVFCYINLMNCFSGTSGFPAWGWGKRGTTEKAGKCCSSAHFVSKYSYCYCLLIWPSSSAWLIHTATCSLPNTSMYNLLPHSSCLHYITLQSQLQAFPWFSWSLLSSFFL